MSRSAPAVRWILGVALAALCGFVCYRIRTILGVLAAGFIVAYVFEPAVAWLERRRIPRPLGIGLVAGGLAGATVLALLYAVPVVLDEAARFWSRARFDRLADTAAWPPSVRDFVARHRADIDSIKAEALAAVKANGVRLLGSLGGLVARLTSSAAALVVGLLNIVVAPIFAYYLLVDYARIKHGAARLLPLPMQAEASRLAAEVDMVLRAFLRGQLGVAAAMGVMYAVGLTVVGTPLGVLVGLAAGLLNIIPYFGLALGLPVALVLSFLEHQSWERLLGVGLVFVITQNVEGWLLTPRLLGRAVGLHPVIVVLAVMVGGELFGFPGIVLAVPVAAAASVFWREALARYRASALYRGATASSTGYAR